MYAYRVAKNNKHGHSGNDSRARRPARYYVLERGGGCRLSSVANDRFLDATEREGGIRERKRSFPGGVPDIDKFRTPVTYFGIAAGRQQPPVRRVFALALFFIGDFFFSLPPPPRSHPN